MSERLSWRTDMLQLCRCLLPAIIGLLKAKPKHAIPPNAYQGRSTIDWVMSVVKSVARNIETPVIPVTICWPRNVILGDTLAVD